jgi:hypothetical protein
MKKLILAYIRTIIVFFLLIFSIFTISNACEVEEVETKDLPICEEYQVSTEENPCKKDEVGMSTIVDALEKLGESGTLPK